MPRILALLPVLVLVATPLLPLRSEGSDDGGSFEIIGRTVKPGRKERASFISEPSFLKESLDVSVMVARGVKPGPTLCLTAAVHGDEINGVEIARRVFDETDAMELAGTLVAIPIVNVWGFRSGNRYLADRRDLNRFFPGLRQGSLASRIAWVIFEHAIRRCDGLIDLHTGSNERTNVPQIRVDLGNERATELAMHFGIGVVIDGAGPRGSLRRAAVEADVPAIIYEAGGPNRFERREIARGVEGVRNVLEHFKMVKGAPATTKPEAVFRSSSWVRAVQGGIFLSDREPGEALEKGAILGTVTDPTTSARVEITAPFSGMLLGMAHPQVVLPGFGLFHIGRHDASAGREEPEHGE